MALLFFVLVPIVLCGVLVFYEIRKVKSGNSKEYKTKLDVIIDAFFLVVGSAFVGFCLWGIVGMIVVETVKIDKDNSTVVEVTYQEIIPFDDSHFAQYGIVEKRPSYVYMYEEFDKTTNSFITYIEVVGENRTEVDESHLSSAPYVEHKIIQPIDAGKGKYWWFWTPKASYIILHIPPDSIKYGVHISIK